jgi:hypothetical protein
MKNSRGIPSRPSSCCPRSVDPLAIRRLVVFCVEAGTGLSPAQQEGVKLVINHLIGQFTRLPCQGCLLFARAVPPVPGDLRMTGEFARLNFGTWPARSSRVATWETLQAAVGALAREKHVYRSATLRIIVVMAPACHRASSVHPDVVLRALRDNTVVLDCLMFEPEGELPGIATSTRGVVFPLDPVIDGQFAAPDVDWFMDVLAR